MLRIGALGLLAGISLSASAGCAAHSGPARGANSTAPSHSGASPSGGLSAERTRATEHDPALGAGSVLRGKASYYGNELAGRPTANGERFAPDGLTAAHRTLPFGTQLRVRSLSNGREVQVRVNDRGPFGKRTRILDLSLGAARRLDMVRAGVVEVEMEVLSMPRPRR